MPAISRTPRSCSAARVARPHGPLAPAMGVIAMAGALLVLLVLAGTAQAKSLRSYHIGNSLMVDSMMPRMSTYAQQVGVNHTVGYHIRPNSNLNQIRNNVDGSVLTSGATNTFYWTTELANQQWDAIVLEPWKNGTLDGSSDQFAFFANYATNSPDARLFVYAVWPDYFVGGAPATRPDEDTGQFADRWNRTPSNAPGQLFREAALWYEHYFDYVTAKLPGRSIEIIPVGHVLYEIEQRIEAGQFNYAGVDNIVDFYRDDLHLAGAQPSNGPGGASDPTPANDIGRFVAHVTTLSMLHRRSFAGLHPNDSLFNALPTDFTNAVSEIAWDVIQDGGFLLAVPAPQMGAAPLLLALAGRRPRRD